MNNKLPFYIIFLWLLLVCSAFVWKQATTILFCDTTFNQAVYKARENNKMLFIYVGSEQCDICERLNKVFTNREVADFYNENFINVKIDPENTINNMRLTNWGVSHVPSMIFMNKKKKIVYKTEGYKDAQQMLAAADSALKLIDKK